MSAFPSEVSPPGRVSAARMGVRMSVKDWRMVSRPFSSERSSAESPPVPLV